MGGKDSSCDLYSRFEHYHLLKEGRLVEPFLTEIELLLLDWQLEGPSVSGVWVFLVLLAVLVVGYMVIQFLLLKTKWSAALQLFSQANIIIPPNSNWWVVGLVLGVLILGVIWWALGH